MADGCGEMPSVLKALQAEQRRRDDLAAELFTREKFDIRLFNREVLERRYYDNSAGGANCWRLALSATDVSFFGRRSLDHSG